MNLSLDWVSILAAAVAPLTVIATVLTAYWNHRYDFRQKRLELYETRRLDATAAFAEAFAKLYKASASYDSAVRSALAATYVVMPYYREPARKKLSELASLLRRGTDREEIYAAFESCLSHLATTTPKG